MSESVLIDTALRLPAPDVDALIEGRMIAAMPRIFLDPGRKFALYPADASINPLPVERYYRPNFLPTAQTTFANLGSEIVWMNAWARCELCQILNDSEVLEALSRLTIWTTEALQQTLLQRPYIFLAYLRVYMLPKPVEVPVNTQGQFVPLLQSLIVSDSSPVLSDRIFTQRRRQLEKLEPPLHPELEELESAILQLNTPTAQQLEHKIKTFLGWTSETITNPSKLQPDWIRTIATLGNRSKELDEGKSNYQAGTDFEIVVRKSLEFLGFTVDEACKGGAGGLDLFCSKPYPLVGECKAARSIPDSTVEQLDRIGKRHLKENYLVAVRLIIGPGTPTKQLQESADVSKTSIINPMTLQKLVELEATYPGAVNLIELKSYLEPGQIDSRIDEYLQKVEGEIKLRSQIVEAVKQLGEPGIDYQTVEIRVQYNAVFAKESSAKLDDLTVHSLLVELSSPLTGYLGRKEGRDGSDRFYFLRDLR